MLVDIIFIFAFNVSNIFSKDGKPSSGNWLDNIWYMFSFIIPCWYNAVRVCLFNPCSFIILARLGLIWFIFLYNAKYWFRFILPLLTSFNNWDIPSVICWFPLLNSLTPFDKLSTPEWSLSLFPTNCWDPAYTCSTPDV